MVKECVHIDTGRYYAAKVINKRMMAGREHMVRGSTCKSFAIASVGISFGEFRADLSCPRFGMRLQS